MVSFVLTLSCHLSWSYQAGLPSVEECLRKAEQLYEESKFLDAMKYYLVSSSPELALDIGLNLVRGRASLEPALTNAPRFIFYRCIGLNAKLVNLPRCFFWILRPTVGSLIVPVTRE